MRIRWTQEERAAIARVLSTRQNPLAIPLHLVKYSITEPGFMREVFDWAQRLAFVKSPLRVREGLNPSHIEWLRPLLDSLPAKTDNPQGDAVVVAQPEAD